MKISIFGIGYVGAVAAACLANSGHDVTAVDTTQVKVDCINQGRSPIVEKGLDDLISQGVQKGNLKATTDFENALRNTEISLICVGTPSRENGSLDLRYIETICRQIGKVLRDKTKYHTVVIRSTVVPGTLMNVVKPILEEISGKIAGKDFGLGNNPEFLRESTAIEDYYHPTQIVVGALDNITAGRIMSLYEGIDAPRTITDVSVAEGVKYVSNSWRANKIGFANEMGNILKRHGVDSHRVMEIFFEDRKINMGPSFLIPGFAFGGSCLPKDVRAIRASANGKGLTTPVFDSLLAANELQIRHAFDMIKEAGKKNVGLLGLSFKPGTDDLRESPLVALTEMLLKDGYTLKIYDPCVYRAKHMDGANRDYIDNGIPHISKCLVAHADDVIEGSDIFVIGNGTKEFSAILDKIPEDAFVIDLVRLNHPVEKRAAYAGILLVDVMKMPLEMPIEKPARKKISIPSIRFPEGTAGFTIFTLLLAWSFFLLPEAALDPESRTFLFAIGMVATWRYSWGLTNFIRSVIYRKFVFPRWRRQANAGGTDLMPEKIYILMTVYRIETDTAVRAMRSVIEEAIACGVPVTIVASIVELQDEFMFRTIFSAYDVPAHVDLKIVRIAGTGKRDGLAHGFRAISRDNPPLNSVAVVMDGDTVLLPDTLRRCAPFFRMMPRLGALTTDEFCAVKGTKMMQAWHEMRFAQRHILMSSIGLSKRAMTLTGRMSMFRADIVTHPDFIDHMINDNLNHWRLGKFKFLTGDDKSSLYWVLRRGYQQIYVPDTAVLTLEDPPSRSFVKSSTVLMKRWFGNMLRTNTRILQLGPARMPFFVWWAFLDQRISMWTALSGPLFAIMLTIKYGWIFLAYYFVWVSFIRWVMTLMILTSRYKVDWRYPFLLYYSHVYGSLIKIWVMFRLDQQSWTRQKTKLQRGLSHRRAQWNRTTSHLVHAAAVIVFICAIGYASQVMTVPYSTLRAIAGPQVTSGL